MRIEQLHLERFGIFEDVTLDFSDPKVQLHLIHGPNEAGKSTALAAIGDLLFGIAERTPYNFRHEYARLRIGATISNAAGDRLSFKRRKRRPAGLLTPDEAALPDGALGPFLGGVDRGLFERLFGLDHKRLREGGDAMLAGGGDLARTLFNVSSGIAEVGQVADGITQAIEEIGALDRNRSRTKPIWRAVEDCVGALEETRGQALRSETWDEAERAHSLASDNRRNLNDRLAGAWRARSRLERLRRAGPLLAQIDQSMSDLASLGEGPDLPEGFETQWRDADVALREAESRHRDLTRAVQKLETELNELPAPGAWPEFAQEIQDLQDELGEFRSKLSDLPKLDRYLVEGRERIVAHIAALGVDLTPEEAVARIPSKPLVAQVRALLKRRAALDADGTAVAEASSRLEVDLAKARLARERVGAPADPAGLSTAIEAIDSMGDVRSRLHAAEAEHAGSSRDLSEALSRLAPWTGGETELVNQAFPALESITSYEQELRRASEQRAHVEAKVREHQDRLREVEAALSALRSGGEVPSSAAVQAARDRRDTGWRLIRRRFVEPTEGGLGDIGEFTRDGDVGGAYEQAVQHADVLVDRRETEAQRIAHLEELTRQRLIAEAGLAEMERRLRESPARDAELARAWREIWAGSGMEPRGPAEMRAWLGRKDDALRCIGMMRKTGKLLDQARTEESVWRKRLLALAQLLEIPKTEIADSGDPREVVRAPLARRQAEWAVARDAEGQLERATKALADHRAILERLHRREADWLGEWGPSSQALALPATATPAEAEAALDEWDRLSGLAPDLAQTRRRRDGVRRDVEGYRDRIAALLGAIGDTAADLGAEADCQRVIRALSDRLNEADRRAEMLRSVRDRLKGAREDLGEAAVAVERATEASETLRSRHGLGVSDDAPALVVRAAGRRRLEDDLRERRTQLAQASEGVPENELRAEAAALGPDAITAELQHLDTEIEALQQEVQSAASAETAAWQALEALRSRPGIGDAAQRAHNSALEVGIQAERWLTLRAAKAVLERAIERYRAANQHPLIGRASEILVEIASTARNPIVRLAVDYRDGAHPVLVGLREDGSHCPIEGMSDGTRDQLYLALRIAVVERHAAEALPFIADDLFITSDEDRTAPGVRALSELGRSTQVLLFTHHRYVVKAAEANLPADLLKVHQLSPIKPQAFLIAAE